MKDIPGFKDFKITEDNKVFNIVTQNELKGSINGAGYRFYHIKNDAGEEKNVGEHRLIALAYFGEPKSLNSVVNHKDGIKLNNDPSNLEWCSYRDNVIHAGKNGLTSKVCSVQVRDVRTKEVLEFETMISCALYFGISKDMVSHKCKTEGLKIFPNGLQFRSPSSQEPWFDCDEIEMLLLDKAMLVKNLLTGEIISFRKLQDAARFLGITPGGLTAYFKRNTQPVVKDIYQLKKTSDKNIWLEPKNIRTERQVKVVTVSSGIEEIYPSARSAALNNNLTPTALDYRLSSEGNKVFSDGKTYQRI